MRLVKTDLAQPESMTTVKARRGALDNIADVIPRFPDCGVIAGRIEIRNSSKRRRPGLSNASTPSTAGRCSIRIPTTFYTTTFSSPVGRGPMMAIRKIAYDRAGGFPPDTIGVESNKELKSFNKLYVGPGTSGFA